MNLSAQERVHLVRLATDRPERYLDERDPAIAKRVLNSLVRKGMAHLKESRWEPSEEGLSVASQLY